MLKLRDIKYSSCSIVVVYVIITVEDGQLPHAPCRSRDTLRSTLSMLTTATLPPSCMCIYIVKYAYVYSKQYRI